MKGLEGMKTIRNTMWQNFSRDKNINILVIGPICWDEIIYPSEKLDGQIGGSVFYVTKALLHIAKYLHYPVSIDVLALLGKDHYQAAEAVFDQTSITRYYLFQERTLQFRNTYIDESDWTQREQTVIHPVTHPMCSTDVPKEVTEKLQKNDYTLIFLLPITPYDFVDLMTDMIPYLRRYNPEILIAIELQGLTRYFPEHGGAVTNRISPSISQLFKQQATSCAHCSIEEGILLIRTLNQLGEGAEPIALDSIATEMCRCGLQNVGVTDGDQGAFVGWQNMEGMYCSQHIPTIDVSKIIPQPFVTGAGDTWFGVYGYTFLGLGLSPVISASLATQFATLKCLNEDF